MRQFLTKMLPMLALLISGTIQAQKVPFWSENFSGGGIPAGWTNKDASAQNVVWTWCNDPEAGNDVVGCPGVFSGQKPFQSYTPTGGFVSVDSDEAGQKSKNHVSELTTTAIDCSGKNSVFVTFTTQIGVYTVSAETGAILRVSTDKTNWTKYTVFPGVSTTVGWSKNPETPIIDISATAANQATVYLQWQWTGNYEYIWNLDDVGVYDVDPTPIHNMVLGDFFFPASSLAQPVSQIGTDSFLFFTYLSNTGLADENNVVVKASVLTDNNEEIFADSVVLGSLAAGVADSLVELPNLYAPELPVGAYQVVYTVRSDSTDERPFDNAVGNPFYVTTGTFAKENGGYQGYRPNGGGDWAVGNLYRMSAGAQETYKATTAQFAFAADSDPTAVEATVYLMKVKDDVDAGFTNFDDASLLSSSTDIVGFGTYPATATAENYVLVDVDLFDFTTQNLGVTLEKGARYFLVVSYTGSSNLTYHAFALDLKMLFVVSTVTISSQWFLGGFGEEFNAAVRMNIDLTVTTDNKPLPETSMSVFPNPVRNSLSMGVKFDKPTDATITIADVTGRVIQIDDRQGLTQDVLTYQLPQLASGTYLARIATADGTLTKKFVVQK